MYHLDLCANETEIISQIKAYKLKKTFNTKNKFDKYIANYFRHNIMQCEDLISYLCIYDKIESCELIALSAFMYLDYTLFDKLILHHYIFNISLVSHNFIIKQMFKYDNNSSSIILKLNYLNDNIILKTDHDHNYIYKLIKAWCYIYNDIITEIKSMFIIPPPCINISHHTHAAIIIHKSKHDLY